MSGTRLPLRIRVFLVSLRAAAWLWRRMLPRTVFIAVTGSVGKTTTKECLIGVLSAHGATVGTHWNQNHLHGVPRTLLRVRPWHRYAVIEVGTDQPGLIARSARLVRPDIAVVLSVAANHSDAFPTLEDTAREKAALATAMAPSGLVLLNIDDARVRAMAAICNCRVVTFGCAADADLRAESVSSHWPERLSMTVRSADQSLEVHTRLVGEHWVASVLATLSIANACDVPAELAVAALARVEPFAARMQPVTLPGGAIVLRDEESGAEHTWPVALGVLAEARVARRIVVAGGVSNARLNSRRSARATGRAVAAAADVALFIGPSAKHAAKAAVIAGMAQEQAIPLADLPAADAWLSRELRADDLVLLKGRTTEHLSRLVFARLGTVQCWRTDCRKIIICDHCPELGFRATEPAPSATG